MKKNHLILILLLILLIAGILFITDKGPNLLNLEKNQYLVRVKDPENCRIIQKKFTLKLNPNTFCEYNIIKNDEKIRTVTASTNSRGFRKTPEKFDNSKKRIVIMGGNTPFGMGLNDNETFPWLLSEKTNKKVYNASMPLGGIQQALIYLMSKSFYKIIKNVDTFIYVFVNDDLAKMYGPPMPGGYDEYYPIFKIINNELTLIPPPPEYSMGEKISGKAHDKAYKKKTQANIDSEKTIKLFEVMMNECKKQIKLKNPNAKFIVLNIENNPKVYDVLKKNKIEVINRDEIFKEKDMKEKYFNLEYRPNIDFWEKFTPLFIKKLEL